MRRAVFVLLCPLAIGAVGSARAETASEAIASANRQFMTAFNGGDANAVAAMYAADAMVLPPDEADVRGRDAIGRYWKAAIDAGVKNLVLESTDIEGSGGYAYEVGTAKMSIPKPEGGLQPISAKYVVVWHQTGDGHWALYRDIWNGAPAAGP